MAIKDDVIKLTYPVQTKHGFTDTLRVPKGQVRSTLASPHPYADDIFRQIIMIPEVAINRSKRMWGEDAHEFRPQRWLEADGIPGPLTSGVFGTFSFIEGPRMW